MPIAVGSIGKLITLVLVVIVVVVVSKQRSLLALAPLPPPGSNTLAGAKDTGARTSPQRPCRHMRAARRRRAFWRTALEAAA